MVTKAQIEAGVARYIDREVIAHLPQAGFQRIVLGTAAALVAKRMSAIIDELAGGIFGALGVIDKDGMVDIDLLRDAVKQGMGEAPFHFDIPMVGEMVFRASDIDVIHSYIVR